MSAKILLLLLLLVPTCLSLTKTLPEVLISEVYIGEDSQEDFIELYDGGSGNFSFVNFSLDISSNDISKKFPLDGLQSDSDGFLVFSAKNSNETSKKIMESLREFHNVTINITLVHIIPIHTITRKNFQTNIVVCYEEVAPIQLASNLSTEGRVNNCPLSPVHIEQVSLFENSTLDILLHSNGLPKWKLKSLVVSITLDGKLESSTSLDGSTTDEFYNLSIHLNTTQGQTVAVLLNFVSNTSASIILDGVAFGTGSKPSQNLSKIWTYPYQYLPKEQTIQYIELSSNNTTMIKFCRCNSFSKFFAASELTTCPLLCFTTNIQEAGDVGLNPTKSTAPSSSVSSTPPSSSSPPSTGTFLSMTSTNSSSAVSTQTESEMIRNENGTTNSMDTSTASIQTTIASNGSTVAYDSSTAETTTLNDSSMAEMTTSNDSSTAEMMTSYDSSTAEMMTSNDSSTAEMMTSNDSSTAEMTTLNDSSTAEMTTSNDSSTAETTTSYDSSTTSMETTTLNFTNVTSPDNTSTNSPTAETVHSTPSSSSTQSTGQHDTLKINEIKLGLDSSSTTWIELKGTGSSPSSVYNLAWSSLDHKSKTSIDLPNFTTQNQTLMIIDKEKEDYRKLVECLRESSGVLKLYQVGSNQLVDCISYKVSNDPVAENIKNDLKNECSEHPPVLITEREIKYGWTINFCKKNHFQVSGPSYHVQENLCPTERNMPLNMVMLNVQKTEDFKSQFTYEFVRRISEKKGCMISKDFIKVSNFTTSPKDKHQTLVTVNIYGYNASHLQTLYKGYKSLFTPDSTVFRINKNNITVYRESTFVGKLTKNNDSSVTVTVAVLLSLLVIFILIVVTVCLYMKYKRNNLTNLFSKLYFRPDQDDLLVNMEDVGSQESHFNNPTYHQLAV